MSARTARAILTALVAVALMAADAPETRLEHYQRLRREGVAAAQAGDLPRAEAALAAALRLYPDVPGSYIRLARVQVAAGKTNAALASVKAYAGMGLTLDVASDPVLRLLLDIPEFAPVAALLKSNAEPGRETSQLARLEPAGAVFEGVVRYEDSFLVSSVAARTLFRVSDQGAIETFLAPDDETGGLFGMAIDRPHDSLWIAEAREAGLPGSTGPARTGLLRISLSRRAVVARYSLPDDRVRRRLGDVVLAEDGTVYASDSVGAAIFRLKPGATTPELVIQSRAMASPQGLAICADGKSLVVADYSTGLHRVDLVTGEEALVSGPSLGLAGSDGVLRIDHSHEPGATGRASRHPAPMDLVVTQNGVTPERLLHLRLTRDCRAVLDASVLTQGRPGHRDLTLATQSADRIVFIGSSGWADYGDEGRLATPSPGPGALLLVPTPN